MGAAIKLAISACRRVPTTRAFGLAVGLGLGACAAHHTVPPVGYSDVAPRDHVLRIAFDMYGDPYPESHGTDDPTFPIAPRRSSNRAFGVRTHYERAGLPYAPDAIVKGWAGQIREALGARPGARLVFLIKGFNNDYRSFRDDYAQARSRIAALGGTGDLVFVEVIWDALYKGSGTASVPVAYFADSLTSSLLAGTCGLRPLLADLPGVDVTFVTHSRGAAVALAVFTKADLAVPRQCEEPPVPSSLGDVRAILFAPALGDGVVRRDDDKDEQWDVPRDLYLHLGSIAVGFNPSDPATSKRIFGISLGARRGGDTRLASDRSYLTEIVQGSAGKMQYVEFDHPSHAFQDYLSFDTKAGCLLWTGKLSNDRPADCTLSR